MAQPEEAFEDLAGGLDYPMFIVTAAAEGRRDGCLVGFTTQTSIEPPRFLVCISKSNRTHELAAQAHALAVHLVPADGRELAVLFGGETGDETDKLERCRWHEGPEGVPLLDECPDWFAGEVIDRFDAGDHTALLLSPFAAESEGRGDHLRFQQVQDIDPGHGA